MLLLPRFLRKRTAKIESNNEEANSKVKNLEGLDEGCKSGLNGVFKIVLFCWVGGLLLIVNG